MFIAGMDVSAHATFCEVHVLVRQVLDNCLMFAGQISEFSMLLGLTLNFLLPLLLFLHRINLSPWLLT